MSGTVTPQGAFDRGSGDVVGCFRNSGKRKEIYLLRLRRVGVGATENLRQKSKIALTGKSPRWTWLWEWLGGQAFMAWILETVALYSRCLGRHCLRFLAVSLER